MLVKHGQRLHIWATVEVKSRLEKMERPHVFGRGGGEIDWFQSGRKSMYSTSMFSMHFATQDWPLPTFQASVISQPAFSS